MDSNTKTPVVKLSELNEESWNSFELGFRALCFRNKCYMYGCGKEGFKKMRIVPSDSMKRLSKLEKGEEE